MAETNNNKTKGYKVIRESILTPVNCVCGRQPETDVYGTETSPFSLSCDCDGKGVEKKVLAKNRMDALTEWRQFIRGLQNLEQSGVHEAANVGEAVTFNQTN